MRRAATLPHVTTNARRNDDAEVCWQMTYPSCPRLSRASTPWHQSKAWMAGTSPAMTNVARFGETNPRGVWRSNSLATGERSTFRCITKPDMSDALACGRSRTSKPPCAGLWPRAKATLEVVGRAPRAVLAARSQSGFADARPLGLERRDAVRAGGAGALGQDRHVARRDRGAGGGQGPAARVRADGLRRDARHPGWGGLARRRAGGQPVGAAPDQGRRRARSFPRLLRGLRPRRDLQVRRPRGEERHRLRSLQAAWPARGARWRR